jgi:hypothetical protein
MMFHFYIPEGICFAASVAFLARGYTMQFLICVLLLLLLLCTVTYKGRSGLMSERTHHKDRTTDFRPKFLKRKQYLVKHPQSGLDTKTY